MCIVHCASRRLAIARLTATSRREQHDIALFIIYSELIEAPRRTQKNSSPFRDKILILVRLGSQSKLFSIVVASRDRPRMSVRSPSSYRPFIHYGSFTPVVPHKKLTLLTPLYACFPWQITNSIDQSDNPLVFVRPSRPSQQRYML
jgi:hypothetical protein